MLNQIDYLYKNGFGIKLPTKIDIPWNPNNKPTNNLLDAFIKLRRFKIYIKLVTMSNTANDSGFRVRCACGTIIRWILTLNFFSFYIGCLNIHGTYVTANNFITNFIVFFFV